MDDADASWEARVAAVWQAAAAETLTDDEVIAAIGALAAERPEDDAAALFERAGAFDSAGREAEAAPLYRRALAGDLDPDRRIQAMIQLGSTLRNLGELEESITLLEAAAGMGTTPSTGDAATIFLAFSLIDAGREREAALRLIRAMQPHLPRYRGSVDWYANEIEERTS